jgi:hypothetical protein
MIKIKEVGENSRHVFIQCDICKVEVDIVTSIEIDNTINKLNWTKEIIRDYPKSINVFVNHYCEKCSLELKNKSTPIGEGSN